MIGATLFSGGGGVEARLKHRIDFRYAVEYDPAIAAVYRANHGDHVQVARVEDVDYSLWGHLDYLHASPVCKEFSQAKTGGTEGESDLSSALAVVRCIEQTTPRVFTLENVGAYQHSKSYKLICRALDLAGYMWHAEVLNSADFGVPQTRRRLILRAVKDSLLPGWPAPVPWIGWYAAIEDLIPTLPPSQFAAWQLARLPDVITTSLIDCTHRTDGDLTVRDCAEPAHTIASSHFRRPANEPRAFIVAGNGNQLGMPGGGSVTIRDAAAPYFTITSASDKVPSRAWLVGKDYNNFGDERGLNFRASGEPAFTITERTDRGRAWLSSARALLVQCRSEAQEYGKGYRDDDEPSFVIDVNGAKPKAWLQSGRVVKMTPRALARFQSLPDSYVLPDKASLACTVIGNMVPSLLMQQVVEPLL